MDITSGATDPKRINKITVNLNQSVNSKDASVNAKVGLGGKMVNSKVLLDSGADFSCVRNGAVLYLYESGVNLVVQPVRDPSCSGIAANNAPIAIVGELNLDIEFKLVSGEEVLLNWTFVVVDDLNFDFIIGMDVLSQCGFGVGRDSLWIGNEETGKICSLKNPDQEILTLFDKKVLGDTEWCLYKVDESMDETLTSDVDSNWSMNRAHGSNKISRINRDRKSEMQANVLLVDFPCGQKIPQRIRKSCSKTVSPTSADMKQRQLNSIERTTFISDNVIEAMVGRSCFVGKQRDELKKILTKHREIFSCGDCDVGEYRYAKAKLKFKPGRTDPVYVPVRRVPMELRSWLKKRLDEMEESGIIQKCDGSPYNSPLFLVKKQSGKWREVNDFRALNEGLEDNHFPLPHLRDLLDQLHGSKYFSSIDLRSGYFNIVLEEESRQCTAFNANGQTYEYLRIPQGIKTAPMIFQREMMKVAGDLLGQSCLVFMDDMLCYNSNIEESLRTIDEVLERFGKAGFLLNPEKCQFGVTSIKYLGFQISEKGWVPTEDKVKTITQLAVPTTVTELKSFLGGMNFFVNSIPNLHAILKPLHLLAGNRKGDLKMTKEAVEAFNFAKQLLANATTVAFFSKEPDDTLFLTTDASQTGWGVMLSQFQKSKGREVPLAFGSGAFGGAELNWPIYEKELFSFVSGLRLNQVYLFMRNFVWRTDNKALSHFQKISVVKNTATKIAPKVVRWLDFIGDFSFSIEHFVGTNPVMRMADFLSRQDFGKISVIKHKFDNWFNIWMTSGIAEPDLAEAQNADEDIMNLSGPYEKLDRTEVNLEVIRGIRTCSFRGGAKLIIIPESLVIQFLEYVHGLNHRGVNQMLKEIYGHFYITDCKERVKDFVWHCCQCRKFKSEKQGLSEPVRQSVAFAPWSHVHMDLSGPFPKSWQGNKYILAVVCNLTRWCVLRAIPSKHAESVAVGLRSVFCEYGPCTSLLSDNGREFNNQDLRKLLMEMGVHLQHSTPYRPQSNGIVERLNQKIKSLLKLHGAEDLTWEDGLGEIQLAINLEFNRSIGTSPYQAFHGWTLENLSFIKNDIQEKVATVDDSKIWIQNHRLKMTRALAEQVMHDYVSKEERYYKACEDYENNYASRRRSNVIDVGSTVLVKSPQPVGVCGKLYSSWKGYYKVVRGFVDNPNVYLVCHENDSKRTKLVHRDVIRVVDVPEGKADVLEEKQEAINVPSQRPPEMIAVGSSGLDSNKLQEDFQENDISNCQDNVEEKSSKRLRSGKRY